MSWECVCERHKEIDPGCWTSGYCSIFAYALRQRFNLPMWGIFEELEDQHRLLVHAFVRHGESVWDANGGISLNNMLTLYRFEQRRDWGRHRVLYDRAIQTRFVLSKVGVAELGRVHHDFSTKRAAVCPAHRYIEANRNLFAELEDGPTPSLQDR